MKKGIPDKKVQFAGLCLAFLMAFGCDDGNGGEGDADADGTPDPDAVEDVTPEPDAEAEPPADVPEEEEAEDVPGEEGPALCTGTDTLTLEFTDDDGNPVEGVVVALKCLDGVMEAASGADGRVSFDDLSLADTPVDFTYVYWDTAFSVVGMGGDTPIPDPLPISLRRPTQFYKAEHVGVSGNAEHATEGSNIWLINSNTWRVVAITDTYETWFTPGMDRAMDAFEFVYDGEDIDLLGYSHHALDVPSGTPDGPDVAPSASADIRSRTLQLDYELGTDSPLNDRDTSTSNILEIYGAIVMGFGATHALTHAGFTTSWAKGETSDTLEVSWVQEGLDAITTNASTLLVVNSDLTAAYMRILPGNPETWEGSYRVDDVPSIPGVSIYHAFPFYEEIEVSHPDWAEPFSLMSYNLRSWIMRVPNLASANYRWCVTVHPDVTSFAFADLPLPSSFTYDDVFIGSMHGGVSVVSYDEDPAEDAGLIANSRCGLASTDLGPWDYKAAAADFRYPVNPH